MDKAGIIIWTMLITLVILCAIQYWINVHR